MAKFNNVLIAGMPVIKEAPAGGAITPGEFIEYTSTGTVIVADTAGGDLPKLVALELETTAAGVDTDYAADDQVRFAAVYPGCEVQAVLAASQTITVGEILELNNAGNLVTLSTGKAVAYAQEDVTTTSGTGKIRVGII